MLSWTVCHEFCVLYLFHQIMAHCYGERGLSNLRVANGQSRHLESGPVGFLRSYHHQVVYLLLSSSSTNSAS
jgi:hypothetical protein